VAGIAQPRQARLSIGNPVIVLAGHPELAWTIALVGMVALAHSINMFAYPFYTQDEGTYVAQAWSVLHLGQLAPYTYWYDHPPLGWVQLAVLSLVSGAVPGVQNSVEVGRISMLFYEVGSTFLVYRIARASGRTKVAATIALLTFGLSGYGLIFHRVVLLDNIAAFWMLAAILPLVAGRLTLSRVWVSAILLGIAVLSKEIVVVVVPAMALLVAVRSDRSHRLLAVVGWLAIALGLASTWILLALLKGELFEAGGLFGGTAPHVSLLATLLGQAARGKDGGLFQATSQFWTEARSWAQEDPVLVIGGSIASLLAIVRIRRDGVAAALGIAVLSLWLFLGRGGITIAFYLLPLLPLLALEFAWLLDGLGSIGRRIDVRLHVPRRSLRARVGALMAMVLISATVVASSTDALWASSNPLLAWTSDQGSADRSAITWIRNSVPSEAGIVIDMYAWLDLQSPPPGQPRFDLAHYYWKVQQDPSIRDGVFGNNWHNIAYLLATPALLSDAKSGMPLINAAVQNADPVVSFAGDGWPVTIERTRTPQSWPVAADRLLSREWLDWTAAFVRNGQVIDGSVGHGAAAELQANALLQAVYMNDRSTFDSLWTWTRTNLLSSSGLLVTPGAAGVRGPGADTDLALALVMGSERWADAGLGSAAEQVLGAIWQRETAVVGGQVVPVAVDPEVVAAARADPTVLVDMSALAPYAYRIFGTFDPSHPWQRLIDGSYTLLARVQSTSALGGPAGTVPHWVRVDRRTAAPRLPDAIQGVSNFYDAATSQLGWRLGLDYLWNQEPRARRALSLLNVATKALIGSNGLNDAYFLDGTPVAGSAGLAATTAALPGLLFGGQVELASGTFTRSILAPLVGSTPDPADAAGRQWGWFATALMDGGLVARPGLDPSVDWPRALAPPATP
jgi:Glycosyl hydrolases family 8